MPSAPSSCVMAGGRPNKPMRLERGKIRGGTVVPYAQMSRNIEHAHTLGFPVLGDVARAMRGPLAIVGGGPSVREHLKELKSWQGDIWGVNGACKWLRNHGVNSTFFSVDALPEAAKHAHGAARAVVATQCDPALFEALGNAEVDLFYNAYGETQASGASSTTATPTIAVRSGYGPITYFGCESSYQRGQTHAYHDEPRVHEMIVRCGGADYLTSPDFYYQAMELAIIIRDFPGLYLERSGGLLRAFVERSDGHEVTWVSEALDRIIKARVQAA
jgi:hypothetical protein